MRTRGDGDGPESIRHATTSDDDVVIFYDFDSVLAKECSTIIITELGKRDESASPEIIEDESSLGSGGQVWGEGKVAGDSG
jgi:hypothetical protein